MQTNVRIGIVILIVLALITIMAVAMGSQDTHLTPKPASSNMESSILLAPSTTTTEATQIYIPSSIDRKIVKPIETNHKIVKPTSHKPSTSTTQFKAESTNMADVKTPLQIAQSMVGQPSQWGNFWCAKFVDAVAIQAKIPHWTSEDGPSELFNDALRDDRIHPLPQVGDMVFFDLRDPATKAPSDIPDVQVMHVGIIETVDGNSFSTIEGNADSSQVIVRKTHLVDDGFTIAFASFPS